ncbi:metallophosphoesterase [Roseovarius sp. EL26]|uniref:metallophosphoesterase n=1 Tax=Roseovarius sp. EL26 TaxID=2126672 RepID=UPI000EA22919|nr:metallophosphoesterase [Roseovarius sp. EL26]
MKITIISDTHGGHKKLGELKGDVLVHCGDIGHLMKHDEDAIERIDTWFGQLQFNHILCIGGNHDLALEKFARNGKLPFKNAVFLHDAEAMIDGVKFYGSSWVPNLRNHAFFADYQTLKAAWSKIPNDTDVLFTHTPPAGILDVSSRGQTLGCQHLAQRLNTLNLSLHCFGHVHASAGSLVCDGTTYVNACSVNSEFEIAARPYEYSLKTQKLRRKRQRIWGW